MTGFMRNLFGTYKLYDTPDYEDLVPKLLFIEKWAIYASGSVALLEILFRRNPPKGFFNIAKYAMKYVGPATLGGATFVGTLYASGHLRGKVDDEWNAFNATVVSGFFYQSLKKNPYTFINYFMIVGLASNLCKQAYLQNWTLQDEESQMKARKIGFIANAYPFDWSIYKERPPKWINADELSEQERAKVKITI